MEFGVHCAGNGDWEGLKLYIYLHCTVKVITKPQVVHSQTS